MPITFLRYLQLLFIFSCLSFDSELKALNKPVLPVQFNQFDYEDMSLYDQQDIVIRGFLYSINDELILAEIPNIKTCCVTNPNKHPHIFIKGLSKQDPLMTHAITLQGVFKFKKHNDYFLMDSTIIENTGHLNLFYLFPFLILSIIIYFRKAIFCYLEKHGKNRNFNGHI